MLTSRLTRRAVLRALPALAFAGGCRRETTKTTTASWPRTVDHDGVEMIELFPNGADERSPLIVAVHGRGDRPDNWVDDWRTFPAKVEILLPRAFDPVQGLDGYSWFDIHEGISDEELGAGVGRAEARLWRGILQAAAGRRVIVTGFSQGGILSFAMASRHPDVVSHAFPVAGACPGPLLPKNKSPSAPVLAFHGTADPVLNIKWSREAVQAFKAEGNNAELREYPGVAHQMTRAIHADLWKAIAGALPPS